MKKASLNHWHLRLGHPYEAVVCHVVSSLCLLLSSYTSDKCSLCLVGKSSRLHLPQTFSKCTKPLELIPVMYGVPFLLFLFYGHHYFVLFIDDFSQFIWLFPIKCKSEFFQTFVKFQKLVEL